MQTASGVFLVASPELLDPNFVRSVVYVIEHGAAGTFGVIVNRSLSLPLGDVWEAAPAQLADVRIAADGGPVNRNHGLLMHGQPDIAGAQVLGHGLALGGVIGQLVVRWAAGPDQQGPRLFLGHSGWGPGQLAAEVAQGAWSVHPGHIGPVLSGKAAEGLWERLMGDHAGLPEASLN